MAKIDINMDDIVEDARKEVEVMLTVWQTQGQGNTGLFRPRVGGMLDTPISDDSGELYTGEGSSGYNEEVGSSKVRFVISSAGDERDSAYIDDDPVEIKASKASRLSAVSPAMSPRAGAGGSNYSLSLHEC